MSEPVTEQDRETVVEALAEALYEEWLGPIEDDSADSDTWDDIGEVERNCFRRMARYVVNRNAAARQAAEQERDEARRIARDHHLLGGCITCMANESEKIAAEQRAERLAVLLKAADSWVFEGTMLHQQILSALEREDAARREQEKGGRT